MSDTELCLNLISFCEWKYNFHIFYYYYFYSFVYIYSGALPRWSFAMFVQCCEILINFLWYLYVVLFFVILICYNNTHIAQKHDLIIRRVILNVFKFVMNSIKLWNRIWWIVFSGLCVDWNIVYKIFSHLSERGYKLIKS